MANQPNTMPPAPHEAHCTVPLALAVAAFLPKLADFIEAERDLEEVQGAFDPAYHAWERDADEAQTRMATALSGLRRTPARSREDHVLMRMIILIDALLGAETQKSFVDLHRRMHWSFFSAFQVQGFGPRAHQTNALLIQARHLVDALVALPLFQRWSDPDLTDPGDLHTVMGDHEDNNSYGFAEPFAA